MKPSSIEMPDCRDGSHDETAPAGWQQLDCRLNPEAKVRAGLVTFTNDPTCEIDLHAIFSQFGGVRLSTNRIYSPKQSTMKSLKAVGDDITAASTALMPDDHLDVLAFGCTSAAIVIGSEVVAERIAIDKPGTKITDPMTSALAAFSALGIRCIALITPYIGDVNVTIANYLDQQGINVVQKGFFPAYNDNERNRVTREAMIDGARQLTGKGGCDALFISCTGLSSRTIIPELESETGVPVITSNQAMAWNMLRLARHNGTSDQFGRLFQL